ncbi:hypothetical protein Mgra_00003921 [Meloidogyne graminicola]|uniref:Uncharacterized protein n=1 Tax=Meloidogyne graminicola TaxID=189291 RepID=A0A8S9ZT63_9BILA|nr:hypothetical protein Mgra_00003921 [Meloidogyne graminicola]
MSKSDILLTRLSLLFLFPSPLNPFNFLMCETAVNDTLLYTLFNFIFIREVCMRSPLSTEQA